MKKLLLSGLLMIIFSVVNIAQVSSTVTRFNAVESGGMYKVEMTFTCDSTGVLYTQPFSVPKYDLVYPGATGTPIVFWVKNVGTYGVPNNKVILQGIFNGSNYVNLDTLRIAATNQTESDTTGLLTMNQKFAPAYRLAITNITADINSGNIGLYFPIKQRNYR
jgi:hypothetical protein